MSAVFLHDNSIQRNFESEMAQYVGYEKAILCQSGWSANVGLMQVIADKDTTVYIDFLRICHCGRVSKALALAIPFDTTVQIHLKS